MDIRTLQNGRYDELFAAADAYERIGGAFADHSSTWDNGVHGRVRSSGWTGDAADRADASLQATGVKVKAAAGELRSIAPVLREGAEAFLLAQNKLAALLQDAKADGYQVGADGSVSWEPATPSAPGQGTTIDELVQQQAREMQATAYSARIEQVLKEAEHADQVTADRLRALTDDARTGKGLTGAAAGTEVMRRFHREDLVESAIPKQGSSPAQVNAWWRALPPEEQQRLLRTHPQEIGNLDGIPSPVRDQANRVNLDRTITRLENQGQLSSAEQEQLAGFRKIKERLAQEDGAHGDQPDQAPQPYLLAIDTVGQGRAAISFGNPDTATDVVSYVPGLGTKISGAGGGDATRAKDLWTASKAADPSKDVASITWIGYDAPQLEGATPNSLAVAGTERAEKGGESYQTFVQGLRATHEGEPAHMTALGHSYGSFTVGQAAQRPGGLPVDDIILVGSPGTGAQHAGQLGIDPKHVWVGASENDPVTHLPSGAESTGMGLGGISGAAAGAPFGPLGMVTGGLLGGGGGYVGGRLVDEHELWFGQDPASKGFGGNRFAVADGPLGFESHSDYWNFKDDKKKEPSDSLGNMARIVTGHGGDTSKETPR
ncbi:alpha/beta hydrolase [Kitasatospora cineracea]|uniref:alpha/beta hydrolase n=1 Tax=Kitasatospora cineracea TaxID=88074 RepID=UPI0038214109